VDEDGKEEHLEQFRGLAMVYERGGTVRVMASGHGWAEETVRDCLLAWGVILRLGH
jgi:hypothetical protein